MDLVSVDRMDYRIFCDYKAIIQSWHNSTTTVFLRNCISFNGTRVSIDHLRPAGLTNDVKTLFVPYSLHTISGFHVCKTIALEYLVFEFGSELQSITDSCFGHSALRLLFFPPSVRFLGENVFHHCCSVACVHFDCQYSLKHVTRMVFSELCQISAIAIPSSVKCINSKAFRECGLLRMVEFELPSQC
jgi:hypothetical protein